MSGLIQTQSTPYISLNNPVIITVIVMAVVIALLVIFFRYVYIPQKKKHLYEEARLTALFAELDPDPILRLNAEGIIIDFNQSASELKQGLAAGGTNISALLPVPDCRFEDLIAGNLQQVKVLTIAGNYYEVIFKGIKDLGFIQVYFHNITERMRYESDLEDYAALQRDYSDRLQAIVDEERGRIAGELHDSISGNLVYLKNIVERAPGRDEEFKLIDTTIAEIKTLVHSIRPVNLQDLGFELCVREEVKKFNESCGIECFLTINGSADEKLNPETELGFFRVIQEALNNVAKHSGAESCCVFIDVYDTEISIEISDDGRGFTPRYLKNGRLVSGGSGLMNMQSRAERVNASFELESDSEIGTILRLKKTFEA